MDYLKTNEPHSIYNMQHVSSFAEIINGRSQLHCRMSVHLYEVKPNKMWVRPHSNDPEHRYFNKESEYGINALYTEITNFIRRSIYIFV